MQLIKIRKQGYRYHEKTLIKNVGLTKYNKY